MIVVQPTWGGEIIESTSDKTGVGFLTATTDILLLGIFWSIPHSTEEHSQSLTAQLLTT